MLNKEQKNKILEEMLGKLELPDSAYEKAKSRYDDLGEWLGRDGSILKDNNPHVFPQGSFRLGTAIRPLDDKEEYDLDLSCKLREGVTTSSHSQRQIKNMVKEELESYRKARGIKEDVKEKPRCWRLEYQDELKFHMDIVPCIPAESSRRQIIFDALSKGGASDLLAENVSSNTSNITDNRHPDFESITDDWQISNPEGYAKWFESQITNSVKKDYMEKAQVDELPLFKRKAPLQRVIQILKRHRDIMFQGNEDSKPISIIITTLAAKAYNGEMDLESSLISILSSMGSLINSSSPRIPNPVDPAEDFSDKWGTAEGGRLQLEENFWNWLEQANRDFDYIFSSDTTSNITTQAARKFLVKLDEDELQKSLGLRSNPVETKKVNVVSDPSPPWTSSNK